MKSPNETLERAFAQLDELASEEYGLPLSEVLTDPERGEGARLQRVARLMGVILKQPFADPVPVEPSSNETGTSREWHITNRTLDRPDVGQWQYSALDQLRNEQEPGVPDVTGFLQVTYHELGMFRVMARSLRNRLCGSPDVCEQLDQSVQQTSGRYGPMDVSMGQMTTSAGATALATYVASIVPWLGGPASPLVAAVVLILVLKGTNGFCRWTEEAEAGSDPVQER